MHWGATSMYGILIIYLLFNGIFQFVNCSEKSGLSTGLIDNYKKFRYSTSSSIFSPKKSYKAEHFFSSFLEFNTELRNFPWPDLNQLLCGREETFCQYLMFFRIKLWFSTKHSLKGIYCQNRAK